MANFINDPETTLIALDDQGSTISLKKAYENIHVWGAPGSGKTSGSGKTIARSLLRSGAGGLVLCSKISEVERWQQYAAENGRENSVFIFDRTQGFNFIEYALARYGSDSITNVVGIIMRVLDDARKARGQTGAGNEPFWDETIEEVLKHTIPVLYSATGKVTIQSILDFAVHAPVGDAAWKAAAKNVEGNLAASALQKMDENPLNPLPENDRKRYVAFWVTGMWQRHDEKTRGNILSSLTSRLGLFNHGLLRDCFCGKTTCIPEMMFSGAVILMNLPVQANETENRLGQMVFKYMMQLAVLGRKELPARQVDRPVFLWVDEAHRFLSLKDDQFLSEGRESNCCCVFLSQGLPSYYAALGPGFKDSVDGFMGKFSTHIFHQNGCTITNKLASEIVGRGLQLRRTMGDNRSTTHSTTKGRSSGTSSGTSWGVNESVSSGESASYGTTRGMNEGGGTSSSTGTSGGFSYGSSHGGSGSSGNTSHSTGWNRSGSRNTSWGISTGSTKTLGSNTGKSAGTNAGGNESQNWSFNDGETFGETQGVSLSVAEQMDNLVEPNYFATSLLSGGEHRIVTGLLWQNGATFANGRNFMLVGFRQ